LSNQREEIQYFGLGKAICPKCGTEADYEYTTDEKGGNYEDVDMYKCPKCKHEFKAIAELNFWELDSYY